MRRIVLLSIFFSFLYISLTQGADMRSLLPEDSLFSGWEEVETSIIRTESDLFDYMNGGAEVYIAFNFRRLAVREFVGEGDARLLVEIYKFKQSADAFGVYTLLPTDEAVDLGDGGGYSLGMVRFWKGEYCCKIFTTGDIDKHRKLVMKAGEIVDSRIDASGSPPDMISLIPNEDRTKEGLYFFHEYISQRNLVYIASWNVLSLSRNTDAVLAKYYNLKAEQAFLFLVQYPSEEECITAYKKLIKEFLEAESPRSNDNFVSMTVDYRNYQVDMYGRFMLFGIEDHQNELLSARIKDLRWNLQRYLGL